LDQITHGLNLATAAPGPLSRERDYGGQAAIRRVARLHGAEEKYHATITRAWLHFVAVHIERWGADSFEEFLESNRELLDSKLIQHFYSRELLRSEPARVSWTSPDLRRLPALA
jgi:hypothetical protein